MANKAAAAPLGLVMTEDDPGAALLSQDAERFQKVTIGDALVVLSTMDDLPVGEMTDFGSDFSKTTEIYLYAEQLTLSGTLKMGKKAVIAANQITVMPDDMPSLSVRGQDGQPPQPPVNHDPSGPAAPPNHGDPGGKLFLHLETVDSSVPNFQIDARGGNGGPGQEGTDSTDGGNGGDGGIGGQVVIMISRPYGSLMSTLKSLYQETNLELQINGIKDFLSAYPDISLLTPLKQVVQGTPTSQEITQALQQVADILQIASEMRCDQFQNLSDTRGGDRGNYGEGKKPGNPGQKGDDGSTRLLVVDAPSDLTLIPAEQLFIGAHPSQCAMMLEKARLMYFSADPVSSPKNVRDTIILLRRLQDRTAIFSGVKADDALGKYLQQHEQQVGAIDSLASFQDIYNQTTQYLHQILLGQDAFGYNHNQVPLASFGFYKDSVLDELINSFTVIENAYNAQFAQLDKAEQTLDHITKARNEAEALIDQDKRKLEQLQNLAVSTARIIDGYEAILPGKKQITQEKIDALKSAIKNWNPPFDFQGLFSAMGAVAFAPESEFNWIAQGAGFLYGAISRGSEIIDDQGQPIQKNYLISRMDRVEADVKNISEGYQALDEGTLQPDDPGAAKLIAEENALMSMLDKISNEFPESLAELQQAFDDYVNTVVNRNAQILYYNATVSLMLRTAHEIAQTQAKVKSLNDEALRSMQADWPALTAFASGLYYKARTQVMEMLDQTSRAFRFWALSDDDPFADAIAGKTLPKIDSTFLQSAKGTIVTQYAEAIKAYGTSASPFPADPNGKGNPNPQGLGFLYSLSEEQLANLKQNNETMVAIPVDTNSFNGWANIRLVRVRLWITGAKTSDGKIKIDITHTGHEQIQDPHGEIFTFLHDSRATSFAWELGDTAQATHIMSLITDGTDASNRLWKNIIEDGQIGLIDKGDPNKAIYALIGPFTHWHIVINNKDNANLDLSSLSSAVLEFHGTNYTLISHSPKKGEKNESLS